MHQSVREQQVGRMIATHAIVLMADQCVPQSTVVSTESFSSMRNWLMHTNVPKCVQLSLLLKSLPNKCEKNTLTNMTFFPKLFNHYCSLHLTVTKCIF